VKREERVKVYGSLFDAIKNREEQDAKR